MTSAAVLQEIFDYYKINANQFAKNIGLSRAQSIYDILDGTVGISKKMAARIIAAYPKINISWLITGEGEMFLTSLNEANEQQEKYLIGKNPFPKKPTKEWAVIEFLVQEIAVDRSRTSKRNIVDCLEELYAKIDLIINDGKDV